MSDIGDRVARVAAAIFWGVVDILCLPFRPFFWMGKMVCVPVQNEESMVAFESLTLDEIKRRINEAGSPDEWLESVKLALSPSILENEDSLREILSLQNKQRQVLFNKMEYREFAICSEKIVEILEEKLSDEELIRYVTYSFLVSLEEGVSIADIFMELARKLGQYEGSNLHPHYANALRAAYQALLNGRKSASK